MKYFFHHEAGYSQVSSKHVPYGVLYIEEDSGVFEQEAITKING